MTAQFQFIMRSGPSVGRTYPLEGSELSIGREAACTIAINDAEVSRKHARMVWKDDGYVLEDFGSTNGTFVNGTRINTPHSLQAGELVTLGENIILMYEALSNPNATLPSPAMAARMAVSVEKPDPISAPVPVSSGQVPAGPVEVKKSSNTKVSIWLISVVTTLLVICACVLFFVLIDQLKLWCEVVPFLVPLIGGMCP